MWEIIDMNNGSIILINVVVIESSDANIIPSEYIGKTIAAMNMKNEYMDDGYWLVSINDGESICIIDEVRIDSPLECHSMKITKGKVGIGALQMLLYVG
jgi:hypothetical protein